MGLAPDDLITELLVAVAQLALGVAGFSGIAIYFKRRPGRLTEIEVYRIAILFLNSGAAMFLSLIPFPLQAFGLQPATLWRTCSALMALFELMFFMYYLPHSQRYRHKIPALFNRYSLVLTYSGGLGNLALQTANALGLAGPRQAAVYMVGAVWLLFHATFQFGRILFVQPPEEVEPDIEPTESMAGGSGT
ncbi:MAG: hypothetical protein ACRENP_26650 [Longimicrobiales bacterium]